MAPWAGWDEAGAKVEGVEGGEGWDGSAVDEEWPGILALPSNLPQEGCGCSREVGERLERGLELAHGG